MQATLGEVFFLQHCLFVLENRKSSCSCCVVYILRQHVTTVTSAPSLLPKPSNQTNKQKSVTLFSVYCLLGLLYCTLQKRGFPSPLPFREKVNSATKFL